MFKEAYLLRGIFLKYHLVNCYVRGLNLSGMKGKLSIIWSPIDGLKPSFGDHIMLYFPFIPRSERMFMEYTRQAAVDAELSRNGENDAL